MAAQTIPDLTDEQKKLIDNYDPALNQAKLSDVIQNILDTLNQHAAEIDTKT